MVETVLCAHVVRNFLGVLRYRQILLRARDRNRYVGLVTSEYVLRGHSVTGKRRVGDDPVVSGTSRAISPAPSTRQT